MAKNNETLLLEYKGFTVTHNKTKDSSIIKIYTPKGDSINAYSGSFFNADYISTVNHGAAEYCCNWIFRFCSDVYSTVFKSKKNETKRSI